MGILIGFFVAVSVALVSLWGVSLYLGPDDLRGCTVPTAEASNCQKADAIVAISGGDTEARTYEAISLYQKGWADTLIFSGAAQDTSGPSNALVMKGLAIDAGIPENVILIDESARDTSENAALIRQMAETSGISRMVLVTSAYHQRRASMLFEHELKDVDVVNHPVPADSQWTQFWWMTPTGWWLVAGELTKIAFLSLERASA